MSTDAAATRSPAHAPAGDPWPGEWLRGALEVCVLAVLDEGPTYGYAITTRLDELGLGTVKGGTLYPLLARLEESGAVTVEWRPGEGGPGRKYFTLTDLGRTALATKGAAWTRFAATTAAVVARSAGHGTPAPPAPGARATTPS
ncbi:PadR family transcriptional regulator [Cellulomonas sp. NS3]|uniref:PadR family transcriptional regulator n=1 Tax=Cellulomonas sp. NS3 TaxID=2973977 RepID=UPI002163E502|nr:PadR family transcriptional regulator [Cellulomonas sp. NS3]